MSEPDVSPDFLSRFGLPTVNCRVRVAGQGGGFSGARLWRITVGGKDYCLRRWPVEHPPRQRLEFIHAVLRHVAAAGFDLIPIPMRDRTGQSVIEWHDALWELAPWLPGVADYQAFPTPGRLASAMQALARFHRAAASFSAGECAASPGMNQRAQQLWSLREGEWAKLAKVIQPDDWPELCDVAQAFAALVPLAIQRISPHVAAAARKPVPLQPCIRDIWHDHVLFTGEAVTGIVDFGAMRRDSVAGDVARLIGSLAMDDLHQRSQALAAYESIRALSLTEREMVDVFDHSAVVLGGINWLRWIYVDRRTFPDRQRVVERLRMLLHRLRRFVSR